MQIEEMQRKQYEIVEFRARAPLVLSQSPFQPKVDHREIEPEPFDLRMTERLRERREYDREHERRCEQRQIKVSGGVAARSFRTFT